MSAMTLCWKRFQNLAGQHVVLQLKESVLCGLFQILYGELGQITTTTTVIPFKSSDVVDMHPIVLDHLFEPDFSPHMLSSKYSLTNVIQVRFTSPVQTTNSWWNMKMKLGHVLMWTDKLGFPAFLVRLLSPTESNKAQICGKDFHLVLKHYNFNMHNRVYDYRFFEKYQYFVAAPRPACGQVSPLDCPKTFPSQLRMAIQRFLYNLIELTTPNPFALEVAPQEECLSTTKKMMMDKAKGLTGPEITYLHQLDRTPANAVSEIYFHSDYTLPSLPPNLFTNPVHVLFNNIPAKSAPQFCNGCKFFKCLGPSLDAGTYPVTVQIGDKFYNVENVHIFYDPLPLMPNRDDMMVEESLDDTHNGSTECDFLNDDGGPYKDNIDTSLDSCWGQPVAMDPFFCAYRGATFALEHFLDITGNQTLNSQDAIGGTLLLWAAVGGHTNTVEMLLNRGADPQIAAFSGETPLHMAVEASRMDLVELLIKANVNVNALTRRDKDTPLHYARDWPVITTLLQYGADPNTLNVEGKTYLDLCCNPSASPYFLGPLSYSQDRPEDFNNASGKYLPSEQWKIFDDSEIVRAEEIKKKLRHVRNYNRSLTGLDALEDNSENIKILKSVIGRHESYTGVCYFTAEASPIDIWSLAFLGYFYLPTFVITKPKSYHDLIGPVIFEVDTTEFSEFTTLSEVDGADAVVLSCYNIYHYEEDRVDDEGKIIVKLKVQNYHGMIREGQYTLNTQSKATSIGEQDCDFLAAVSRLNLPSVQFQEMLQTLKDRCPFGPPTKPVSDNLKKRSFKQPPNSTSVACLLEALGVCVSKLDRPPTSVGEGVSRLLRPSPFPMPPNH